MLAAAAAVAAAGVEVATTTRVAVQGDSMRPALAPGDCLLVSRVFGRLQIRPGRIVVVRHPVKPGFHLVKRVREVAGKQVWVEGDGPGSTDSRAFGPVGRGEILGTAWLRYWPAKGARLL